MPAVPDFSRFGVSAIGPRASSCSAEPLFDGVRPCGLALGRAWVGVAVVADDLGSSNSLGGFAFRWRKPLRDFLLNSLRLR